MKEFPLERYRFFVVKNMVVAVSSFAGHRVRATAKADPRDKFDLEKGKRLAAARCNLKVAEKRKKHAKKQKLSISFSVSGRLTFVTRAPSNAHVPSFSIPSGTVTSPPGPLYFTRVVPSIVNSSAAASPTAPAQARHTSIKQITRVQILHHE